MESIKKENEKHNEDKTQKEDSDFIVTLKIFAAVILSLGVLIGNAAICGFCLEYSLRINDPLFKYICCTLAVLLFPFLIFCAAAMAFNLSIGKCSNCGTWGAKVEYKDGRFHCNKCGHGWGTTSHMDCGYVYTFKDKDRTDI